MRYKTTIRRVATLSMILLLVTATPSSVVQIDPVGTASASHSSSTTIDDFEDGDTTTKSSDWDGWTDSTHISANSTNPLSGSQSGRILSDSNEATVSSTRSSNVTADKLHADVLVEEMASSASQDDITLQFWQGNNLLGRVEFSHDDQNIQALDSGTAVDLQPFETDTKYDINYHFDWSVDTYQVEINGDLYGPYNFKTSASGFDQVRWYGRSGNSFYTKVDDVRVEDVGDTKYANGLTDDFEDDNTIVEPNSATGWDLSGPGSLYTESDAINGTSMNISAPQSTTDTRAEVVFDNGTTDVTDVSAKVALQDSIPVSGSPTDGFGMRIKNSNDNVIAKVFWNESAGEIEYRSGPRIEDRTQFLTGYSTGSTDTVKFENIDYGAGTLEVVVNGERFGPLDMNSTHSNDYQTFQFISDTENGGLNTHVDDVYAGGPIDHVSGSIPGGSTVSGHVVTQSGVPVSNATVVAMASKKVTVSEARDHLNDLGDVVPKGWDDQSQSDFSLFGSGGAITETDQRYAAIYDQDDLGGAWNEQSNLESPLWNSVPKEERVALVIGKKDCGVVEGLAASNRQVPGCLADSGEVEIEKLVGTSGDVVSKDTVAIDESTDRRGFDFEPDDYNYGLYQFESPGFYRISAAGSEFSYLVKVGSTQAMLDNSLETINGTLSDHASEIQNEISSGALDQRVTTTNSSGYYEVTLDTSTTAATINAHKVSGVQKQLSLSAARSGFENGTYEGSIYLPSSPRQVSVPASDVSLTMRELSWPENGNLSQLQNRLEDLREQLRNQTHQMKSLIEMSGEETVDQLRQRYAELAGLVRSNPTLEEAYLRLSDRDAVADANELSESELRTEIPHMTTALATTAGGGDVVGQDPNLSGDTITKRWEVDGIALDQANVSVIAAWANGTTQPVGDQYVDVNPNRFRDGGEVVLRNFPLGDNEPAAATFTLSVAGADGFAQGKDDVRNPTFDGQYPELAAVEFNTIRPGPDDLVRAKLHPANPEAFGQLKDATVAGPNGTDLPVNVSGGDTLEFETNGVGPHSIDATLTNGEGKEFVETLTVTSAPVDQDRPPSITATSSPVSGIYAVVSDGFESGDVRSKTTTLQISGQLPSNSDVPSEVHVYTSDLSGNLDRPTTVQIVQGESEQNLRKHVYVSWHTRTIPDEAIVWRNQYDGFLGVDEQPLTRSGTEYGSVSVMQNKTLISTYSDSQGGVTSDVSTSPGRLEGLHWRLNTDLPDVDLPVVGIFTAAGHMEVA